MNALTRNQIIALDDLKPFDVEVPEWGGTIRLRGLSGTERQFVEDWYANHPEANGSRKSFELATHVIIKVAMDESGARLFQDDDFKTLMTKSGGVADALFSKILKASAMSTKEREEQEGN